MSPDAQCCTTNLSSSSDTMKTRLSRVDGPSKSDEKEDEKCEWQCSYEQGGGLLVA